MTPLSPARRAAEEFASVVDGTRTDDRYAELLAYVGVLRTQEAPAPRPEFVTTLRERLMDAADTLLLPAEDRPPAAVVALEEARRHRRQRRLSLAAAAMVVVGGTAGVAAAAESALPGDPLYPIKRGIESAQVSFNSSDSGKGQDLLRLASTRLDEIGGLISEDRSADQIRSALSSYRNSAADGADLIFVSYQRTGDPSDLSRLRTMLGAQLTELDRLAESAPSDTESSFAKARSLITDLDDQARVLCGDCGPETALSSVQLSSAPSLESLLVRPAERTQGGEAPGPGKSTSELAEKADEIAKDTPLLPGPVASPAAPPTDVADPSLPLPTDSPTGELGPTVTGVTGGVAGLLDQVGSATGTGTVTDPLTDTLGTTLGTLLGLQK